MILDQLQITKILTENPQKDLVLKGITYSKKMRRHMYGEEMDKHIENIKGFEREEITELRQKYCRSNKDLFSRLGRPIDKVFSARGGSIYYNLSSEQEHKARILQSDVRNGYSIRKWVEVFWRPHLLDDPYGIIFLEIPPQPRAIALKNEDKSFVYPTYKPISKIFDYLPKGNRLEYVVFKLTAQEKKAEGLDDRFDVFRVVDDAFDYYFKVENQQATVLSNHTFPNYFGEVPAIINSDLINPTQENTFLSLYDDVIELAEDFILDGSVKRIHKFRHGFPKYSEFAGECRKCNGTGLFDGDNCTTCQGTGKSVMTNVSDVKLLSWPGEKEPVILPDQVGGYVEPSETFHRIATEDIQQLEDLMNITLWGHSSKIKAQGPTASPGEVKTATEVQDEVKPESDRLFPISEMAEKRHKFILDFVVKLQITYAYGGSSVNYGRRYMLEGPDVIWQKYSDARQKGAPQNVLDSLLNEYYEATFQSDPVGLQIAKKLMYVEPFVHYTTSNLKALSPDPVDYAAKLYFSEWIATTNEAMMLSMTAEELRVNLYEYTASKALPAPEPVKVPI